MRHPRHPILIVDDEPGIIESLKITLHSHGLQNTLTCNDSRDVVALLMHTQASAVVLDLNMPHISGETLITQIKEVHPDLSVIVVTGYNDVEKAVRCLQNGADDYLVKPIEELRFITSIRRAIHFREMQDENQRLAQRLLATTTDNQEAFSSIVTRHPTMLQLFQYVEAISPSPKPALITGETGTGKELFARAIHQCSGRSGDFVPINVAGLDDHAFNDTLFGHIKGAFTSADSARVGAIARADKGTLLLDEIGDLSSDSQLKLLRVIQEQEYYPLGADIPRKADVRIVGCTNRSLEQLYASNTIRKDFLYRICTHHITIPPLRERIEDLPLLLTHLFEKGSQSLGKPTPEVPPQLISLLSNYTFPGNIRELEAITYEAISRHHRGPISLKLFHDLTQRFSNQNSTNTQTVSATPENSSCSEWIRHLHPLPTIQEFTDTLVSEALRRANGSQSTAARFLGISRQALNKRVNQS